MQHHEAIRQLIRRVRARWRMLRLFNAAIRGALGVSLVLALTIVTTNIVGQAPLLFGAVGVAALLLAAAVLLWSAAPLRHVPSEKQVARFIEERAESLDDRLASAVHVAASPTSETFQDLAESMLADAAARARAVDINTVVPSRALMWRGLQGGAAIALLLILAFAARGIARQSVDALMLAAFPSSVRLEVSPGDARVEAGAPLAIRARLVGSRAPVVARVQTRVGAGWRTADMVGDGAGRFRLALQAVTSSFTYRVTAGSASSREYSVTVAQAPRVTRIDIDYSYPPALGLAARIEKDGGDIYAPAGTDVRLHIRTDRAVAAGRLALADGPPVMLTASTATELTASMKVVADTSYRIALTDRDGLASPGDTEYFIRTLEDRPPQVRILMPAADRGVTALEEVDIEAQADDDFGVARLELVYAVGGRAETVVPLSTPGVATSVKGRRTLFLEDLRVRPGDFVSYYVRAFDRGRGRSSNEARSDIFFLEVKPFEQEFALAQSQTGSGSRAIDDLVAAQKEVVVATWKLDGRARKANDARSEQDIRAVARAESDLKAKVERTASLFRTNTMRNPRQTARGGGGQPPRAGQTRTEEEAMTEVSTAMGRAVTQLTGLKTREAVPHEMDALTFLLKAQADVSRREVSRDARGDRGSNNANYDLSTLFDKELQRNQETNYEHRRTAESSADQSGGMLERIKDLARRQDELLKRQQDLARSREMLTEQELQRELEKLTREQSELRQSAEDAAAQSGGQQGGSGRGIRDASSQMRRAANDLRRRDPEGATASGRRALDTLREIERQLQTRGPDDRRRVLGDMQLEARQLADAERRIATELGAIEQEADGRDTARRLAGEQEELVRRARKLQETLKPAAGAPGDAGREIERQRLVQRMEKTAAYLRAAAGGQNPGGDPRRTAAVAGEVARSLDRVAAALAAESGTGDGEPRRLAERLAMARRLRERLDNLGREVDRLGRQGGTSGSSQSGQKASGETRKPGEGQQGSGGTGTDVTKLRDEYARQLQQTRELLREVDRLDSSSAQSSIGSTPEGQGMVLSAPGTEAFKQDFAQWEQLRLQATQALQRAELSISKKLLATETRDRLAAGVEDKAPPQYQERVDRYFKAIATRKKNSE